MKDRPNVPASMHRFSRKKIHSSNGWHNLKFGNGKINAANTEIHKISFCEEEKTCSHFLIYSNSCSVVFVPKLNDA
jgi:hypothetical protein